jgi:hypothetical protein
MERHGLGRPGSSRFGSYFERASSGAADYRCKARAVEGFPFCAIAREDESGVESVRREGVFIVAATISQWDHGLNPEVQMAEGGFER